MKIIFQYQHKNYFTFKSPKKISSSNFRLCNCSEIITEREIFKQISLVNFIHRDISQTFLNFSWYNFSLVKYQAHTIDLSTKGKLFSKLSNFSEILILFFLYFLSGSRTNLNQSIFIDYYFSFNNFL